MTVEFAGPRLCGHHCHRADGFYAFIHGHPLRHSPPGLSLHVHHLDDRKHPLCKWKKQGLQTCASHLTILVIPSSITVFIDVTPFQKEYLEVNKVPSVLSSVVTPFLNPFIYTLRNDTVLRVLRDV